MLEHYSTRNIPVSLPWLAPSFAAPPWCQVSASSYTNRGYRYTGPISGNNYTFMITYTSDNFYRLGLSNAKRKIIAF